ERGTFSPIGAFVAGACRFPACPTDFRPQGRACAPRVPLAQGAYIMATTIATHASNRRHGAVHVGLWALQILLAGAFVFFGGMKLTIGADEVAGVTGPL